jgi:hypothetical protein
MYCDSAGAALETETGGDRWTLSYSIASAS